MTLFLLFYLLICYALFINSRKGHKPKKKKMILVSKISEFSSDNFDTKIFFGLSPFLNNTVFMFLI